MKNVEEYSKQLKQSQAPILGHFVWWSLNENHIEFDQLENIMRENCLNVEDLPPRPSYREGLIRAMDKINRDYSKNRETKEDGRLKKTIVRKVCQQKNRLTLMVINETIDLGNEDMDLQKEIKIVYDSDSNEVICSDTEHPSIQQILKLAKDVVSYADSDYLRKYVKAYLEMFNILNIRPRGGIYFIPLLCEDFARKLQEFLGDLGPKNNLWIVPQLDAEELRAALTSAFEKETTEELAWLVTNIYQKGRSRKPRSDMLENAANKIKNLRGKSNLYKTFTDFDHVLFLQSLEKLEQELERLNATTTTQ